MTGEINIPKLSFPFSSDFPVTFAFGEIPLSAGIAQKYREWKILGHNGVDFGLPEGTFIMSVDSGTVIQSGENGDFGISVTVKHSWGHSLYAHLSSSQVSVAEEIHRGKIIGRSGHTGLATGPHLHFGIKPDNPDLENGYLGFIDPLPYFV